MKRGLRKAANSLEIDVREVAKVMAKGSELSTEESDIGHDEFEKSIGSSS